VLGLGFSGDAEKIISFWNDFFFAYFWGGLMLNFFV